MKTWMPHKHELGRSWRDVKWTLNGYELEYRVRSPGDTPDTGWYLFGPKGAPFGEYMAATRDDAKAVAEAYIGRLRRRV